MYENLKSIRSANKIDFYGLITIFSILNVGIVVFLTLSYFMAAKLLIMIFRKVLKQITLGTKFSSRTRVRM